jgi:hypothetical protein
MSNDTIAPPAPDTEAPVAEVKAAPKRKAPKGVTPLVPGSTYTSRQAAFDAARAAGFVVYERGKRIVCADVAGGTAQVFYLGGTAEMARWDAMRPMA